MRKEGKEQEERLEWERARWMKFLDMQLNPNIKKAQKPRSPQEWIRFPWERQTEMKPPKRLKVTKKQQAALQKIFDKVRESNGKDR